ncbi:hypothetical protein [Sandaracinus amylolyticus]|uniref:hypothetical protein n=1 Tax=Sandaracinus amylolyticus TaxID=927083 RepID=UPI001F45BCFD|nr:hypothetical protein [Sandaracinus amylolyticus]UJR81748.1 Hypothetical protein I5071_38080 [Sandaracinus amylolyticus]
MKSRVPIRLLIPALLALAAPLFAASRADAQTNCRDLPNVVIGAGGSASVPLLARVGAALRSVENPAVTVVYQSPGACFGITPYVDGTTITGTASYWDPPPAGSPAGTAPVQRTCNLPLTGVVPDFGMMGTAGTLCEGVTEIPAGIGDFAGPITSWSLIVPQTSAQTVIAAEAAYLLYGFGPAEAQVSPWTDPAHFWGRNPTSAALIAIALAIDVPPERMGSWFSGDRMAWDVRTNQAMIQRVYESGQVAPEATLGFVSTEVADNARDQVRTLAYQHYEQSCGYLPDSTATRFDKRNVRDGHYFLWSSYHFYAPVDGAGQLTNPLTRALVGYFTGEVETPEELPLLEITAQNGNIPECAMQVWRDTDMGPLYSYLPTAPCGCYYEEVATGTAPASCTACDEASDCTAPGSVCRFGYCEVR